MARLHLRRQSVPNLVVAQRVLDKMAAAAAHFIADETGEAMVGLLVPGTHTNGVPTLYVLDTIAPDDSAVRLLHTFQQGDERQDELIWWLQENWRAAREQGRDADGRPLRDKWDVPLRYLGDWHKQPGYMIQPSQGDLMTARSWILDESNGMDFLLAPIVTLGHPATTAPSAPGVNYVTLPQGEDTCMRVDFWYLDQYSRDFLPITPTVYPDDQLPQLSPYPWHLLDESRFRDETALLERDGLFVSLVLWEADHRLPLEVCLLAARPESSKVLLLVTAHDYPASPPQARIAPMAHLDEDDDIYSAFETIWAQSSPAANPPDWTWAEGRRLLDYVYALEEAHHLRPQTAPARGLGGGQPPEADPPPAETKPTEDES